MPSPPRLPRRTALATALGAGAAVLGGAEPARAFGDAGAFNPRLLSAGGRSLQGPRTSGATTWAEELIRRTSAPARLVSKEISLDKPALYSDPFAIWAGDSDVGALSLAERRGLEEFVRLGGVLVVDDADPRNGAFGRSVRRELKRVFPESPPVRLNQTHVLYKTFYIVDRPVGRVLGPPSVDAIVRGKNAQVILLAHDLLGALARSGEGYAFAMEPGSFEQREQAVRFAVNIAMYVLCSDYKDDQVHAPFLMRRRARARP